MNDRTIANNIALRESSDEFCDDGCESVVSMDLNVGNDEVFRSAEDVSSNVPPTAINSVTTPIVNKRNSSIMNYY